MDSLTLLYKSSTLLQLQELKNTVTGELIADAEATVTLVNHTAVPVGGQVWPLTLAAVADRPGDYQVTLPPDLEVKPIDTLRYTARVRAVVGSLERYWEVPVRVRVDTT